MSAVIAKINTSSITSRPQPVSYDIVIGKDILDLLAGAMYSDPLDLYREYVQNAADSIDEARDQGLPFSEEPDVLISFDQIERVVKIQDRGVGIPSKQFVRRLTSIGASQKRGKGLRGFRGVGRLSGLGYCQELIFRSRSSGEERISEMRWDGRVLREMMRNPEFNGSLADIIQKAVTTNSIIADGYPDRFFEVELRKISRLRNDVLLNEEAVRSYLSQVAPVPFSKEFKFGRKIQKQLEAHGIRMPIHIEVNDGKGQIFHRAQNAIMLTDTISDPIKDVEFVSFQGADGETCAIGWISDHSYAGSIPKRHGLGGIRLRAGNIQVGDELILSEFFPEARFAGWAMGDIHIISPKILPNGRRDEFEPSAHYSHLQGEISIHARKISQTIRTRSAQRNRLRAVQQQLGSAHEWLAIAKGKKQPFLLAHVICEMVSQKVVQGTKEVEKLPVDSEDRQLAEKQIDDLNVELQKLQSQILSSQDRTVCDDHNGPITTVLRTILSNSKSKNEGISLSIAVLNAIG